MDPMAWMDDSHSTKDEVMPIPEQIPEMTELAEELRLPKYALSPQEPVFEIRVASNPSPIWLTPQIICGRYDFTQKSMYIPSHSPASKCRPCATPYSTSFPSKSSRPASEWYPPPPLNPKTFSSGPLSATVTKETLPGLGSGFRQAGVQRYLQGRLPDPWDRDLRFGYDVDKNEESEEAKQTTRRDLEIETYGLGHDWDLEEKGGSASTSLDQAWARGGRSFDKPWGSLQEGQA
ncbi:hypothetical protein VTL71DRAFT_3712 [Oculimacula yallundae]|uniref:Uncharacterized protein n=1 Tax=Oculimacula yallundae TaxID=86028 RepID=A0ABR4C3R5_9HELO